LDVNFPSWAPKSVITNWQEKIDEANDSHRQFPETELDTSEADVYFRLLTYPDMASVWQRLPKYKIKPTSFICMVILSNCFLEKSECNRTPKEHTKWLNEVKDTAKKLADLVAFSDFDRLLEERYYHNYRLNKVNDLVRHSFQVFKPGISLEDLGEPESERWPDFNPGKLSDNLLRLAKMGSEEDLKILGKFSEKVLLEKPNHEKARRTYFIKKMTQLLREKTGKPLRDIVTITTATVFDEPTITERQIIRTAP
jgi:hypothetical protein